MISMLLQQFREREKGKEREKERERERERERGVKREQKRERKTGEREGGKAGQRNSIKVSITQVVPDRPLRSEAQRLFYMSSEEEALCFIMAVHLHTHTPQTTHLSHYTHSLGLAAASLHLPKQGRSDMKSVCVCVEFSVRQPLKGSPNPQLFSPGAL